MDLSGHLVAVPGASPGQALRSTRPAWVSRLAQACPADVWPSRVAAVLALCGGAHRLTATLAVKAARGAGTDVPALWREALRRDTLREHLRRWWLDTPAGMPGLERPDPAVLATCPMPDSSGSLEDPALHRWLAQQVTGGDLPDWLAAWERAPAQQAATWAEQGRTVPARQLRSLRRILDGHRLPMRAWPLEDLTRDPVAWAHALQADPDLAQRPLWQGASAETGPWTRARSCTGDTGRCAAFAPVWMRAAARAAEVVRLALPGGAAALALGAASPAPGVGLAWCEMARGLLLHAVWLRSDGCIADARVVAPTDWNTHPGGALSLGLSALAPQTPPAFVRAMVAAFDPCVELRIANETAEAIAHA